MRLNTALARLGANPRDLGALLEAGESALAIGDIDAAIGFFTRADQTSPGNPRVKAGLASALVRNGNPFDAIPMFAEAERTGTLDPSAALDWGLAYDLVANNLTAQRYYRQAMAAGPNDEAVRRLSLSQAIAGDKRGSEITIKPLLDRQDKAAWRTRAFSLAILGRPDEAISVVNATLPPELAGAIAPYLRYMPRLTPAQQAAAANFGQFPRASEIGQDDPRVAALATNTRRPGLAAADTALIPRGQPLGQTGNARESREARREREAREAQEQRRAREERDRLAREQRDARERLAREQREAQALRQRQLAEAEAAARRNRTATIAQATPQPVPRPMLSTPGTATPLPARPVVQPVPAAPPPTPTPTPAPTPRPATVAVNTLPPPVPAASPAPAPVAAPLRLPPPTLPQTAAARPVASPPSSPTPAAALAVTAPAAPATAVPAGQTVTLPTMRQVSPTPAPAARTPPTPAARRRVADAFGDISAPVADSAPAAGAVDIRRIRPQRIVANPAPGGKAVPAKPAAPVHPSRIWVQVGTGRDKNALGFDWRRMNRTAAALFRGKRGYISGWGQTNRLLTGPFESEAAATAFINQLRRSDISAFVWTSPAGQVVDVLGAR